ncbi:MAG: FtsX-like permease family protein, partial [Acholeplasmataceae bacterium]|nr:FtsX-like permease family protein [Acholeplasmataceae bacterium]
PTGALDSKTSLQIMEILKKISNDKLIIMVTHNPFLAKTYSDRTIHLLAGEVQSDSQPYVNGFEPNKKNQTPRTSMSFPTALRLSFNNLFTKKIRTIITSIAGSIGIIGVAMVLSLSNGLTKYVDTVQTDLLASLPILIERTTFIVPTSPPTLGGSQGTQDSEELFPDYEYITPYIPQSSFSSNTHVNVITQDYMDYLDTIDPGLYDDITYRYSISPIFLKLDSFDASYRVNTSSFRLGELAADNSEYLLSQYDLLAGEFPLEDTYDAVIVVNTHNQLPDSMLNTLGFAGQNVQVPFEDLIGMTFKLVTNDQYYIKNEIQNKYNTRSSAYFDEESLDMRVVGILRMKPDASANILSMGIGYTSAVTNYVLETSRESQVVEDQLASFLSGEISGIYYNVISGNTFTRNDILNSLTSLGAPQFPNRITIYPKSFESKDIITGYLRDFNSQFNPQTETSQMIIHTDISEAVSSVVGQMISTITIVLVAFAGISLFVSSIMIGIITYVSVIERTKEIGVLRSIGARKKDITRVFNAETMIIGFGAGVIGIALTMILNPIINMVFYSFTKARNLASLTFTIAFVLILVSVALTLIAGLIPAKIASKKDPVVALRTE